MSDEARQFRSWGFFGAFWAAAFGGWLLLLPERVPDFAWEVKPRLAQVFIGAGYVFRTGLFLSIALWPSWTRIRWIFWGNLVFTGTLLLATFWHADQVRWGSVIGHLWLFLYVAEPVALIYLVIGRSLTAPAPATGGPLGRWFVRFLMATAGILAMFGLLLLINPEFAAARWPWELNPFDARIASAWVLGWAVWSGTMAFAHDWDEIRIAAGLAILNGLAVLAASVASLGLFDSPRAPSYLVAIASLTVGMAFFFWRQERARPGRDQPSGVEPAS